MSLLSAVNYDPAAAVTKNTTAALAMTALDTTNLRLPVFTVPGSGNVLVRMQCTIHGAATCPQILLGVLDGATVKHRQAPKIRASNLATTTLYVAEAQFVITGLTPAASISTWDAAYGVETLVASTGIKYGGPNNTTANDAFGAFVFEAWAA